MAYLVSYITQCSEATPNTSQNIAYKPQIHSFKENYTHCNSNSNYVVSGHIDTHALDILKYTWINTCLYLLLTSHKWQLSLQLVPSS